MTDFDVLIIGGGIAGASLAAEIAGKVRTVIVEAESYCGYHSTGRSAAFWLESYGGSIVAQLSAASHAFLGSPPADFADRTFLRRRGALHVTQSDLPNLPDGVEARVVERTELEALVPGIRPGWVRALLEPGCADIDVAGLHAAYLRRFKALGGTIRTDARLIGGRFEDGYWLLRFETGETLSARIVVNAAGAWADPIAESCGVSGIGISPKRRTMVQLRVGRSGLRDLPQVIDANESFYFKGEGDRSIWLSPHDEIETDPCDAAPDEIDIATAINRFERVVDWPVEIVERSWAGLRSFAPDRVPVYGFDPTSPAFFWCAGQGGFGIQTAPAAARLAGSLLLREAPHESISGIDPAPFAPSRLRG
jgi:D-arginine dehydrogenase